MLNFQNQTPYTLPSDSTSVLPQGMASDFFSSLDATLQAQQAQQENQLLGFQQSRGLLNSGDTNYQLINQILGPAEARRQQAFLPYAFQAAQIGQGQQYQTAMEKTQFDQQLQFLQQEYQMQQELLKLKASLTPTFGQEFMSNFGAGLGNAASIAGSQFVGHLLGGGGSLLGGGGSGMVGEGGTMMGSPSSYENWTGV